MPNLKSVHYQQSGLSSLENFVKAYQEVTVYQMQRVRDAVLNQRSFMNGLLDVFIDIKQDVQTREFKKLKSQDTARLSYSTLIKNNKTALVFLSLDTRFAGNSTRQVFNLFREHLEKYPIGDVIIVGALGERLFRSAFPQHTNYKMYELKESIMEQEVSTLINDLLEYQNVEIFTSYFESLIQQRPVKLNVTAAIPIENQKLLIERQKRHFLFEPTGEKILNFFEVQIFSGLLKQTIEETRLATLGNRITTLENTYDSLERQLIVLAKVAKKVRRKEMNKKQRQRLAGISLWT